MAGPRAAPTSTESEPTIANTTKGTHYAYPKPPAFDRCTGLYPGTACGRERFGRISERQDSRLLDQAATSVAAQQGGGGGGGGFSAERSSFGMTTPDPVKHTAGCHMAQQVTMVATGDLICSPLSVAIALFLIKIKRNSGRNQPLSSD